MMMRTTRGRARGKEKPRVAKEASCSKAASLNSIEVSSALRFFPYS